MLGTVHETSKRLGISLDAIRGHIRNADTNGLAETGAIVRRGVRRIYLNQETYERWLFGEQLVPLRSKGALT